MINIHIFGIIFEPKFNDVVKFTDKISKEYGMSRSVIMRTVLNDYSCVGIRYRETVQHQINGIRRKKIKKF